MRVRSDSGSTRCVPARLAMTPPRSISPTSTTGTSAASAKPILAMSPWRKLVSAGLPAPSTKTISACSDRCAKLSSTAGNRTARRSRNSAARNVPRRLPWTITCAPVSVSGFSSTGFMWTLGGIRAARACTCWARPISPPSTATAALFDMFCGLKGATFNPRRTSARASPATSVDLPALDPVPWIISAGVRII